MTAPESAHPRPAPTVEPWAQLPDGQLPDGQLPDGQEVRRFTLHGGGLQVQLIEYGARLIRVQAPDRAGRLGDVTLGHDDLEPYRQPGNPYFGATVGRYANRIARGRCTVDGQELHLAINNPPNHLHGGPGGFDAVLWHGELTDDGDVQGVLFTRVSPDGEEGYPGEVQLQVRYTLSAAGTLAFEVHASTTRPTLINVTNHAYWNLADGGAGPVTAHHLNLPAEAYLPVDAVQIPLGPPAAVDGTRFDFRAGPRVGDQLTPDDVQQQRASGGFDHHFVLPSAAPGELRRAATLTDPGSGRQLELWTTEPGVQLYSGNFLDGSVIGRGGVPYHQHASVCLEPQHAPDSPNHPEYPSVVLRPGETYHTRSEWRFSVLDGESTR